MKQIYTLGFVIFKGVNQVLLIEKQKPEWQKGSLNGLGGKVEDGETVVEGLIREIEEESGLKTTQQDWTYFCVMDGQSWHVCCFIAMLDYKRLTEATKKETEELVFLDLNKINTCYPNLLGNIPWLVGMGMDAIMNKGAFDIVEVKYEGLSKPYNINKI